MQPSEVDVRRSFTELGLDSIVGVEWVKSINRVWGTNLSATRIYDYPSVHELAAYLLTQVAAGDTGQALAAPPAPQCAPDGAQDGTARGAAPEAVRRQLQASLAEALFMRPEDIDMSRSFTELGLDSIVGVEWVKALNKQYGTSLSATRIYDYPNVGELAAFVVAESVAPASMVRPAPSAEARSVVERQLKASLAEALFMQPDDIDAGKSFTELGLDSIVGVEWVKAINKQYGTDLSATRIYDYPSVREMAGFVSAALGAAAGLDAGAGQAGAIVYEPKGGGRFERLYFRCAGATGDFEASGEFAVRYTISPETNVCLKEHVVFGQHLLPTDAYVELVCCAYRTYFAPDEVRLEDIAIVKPILGTPGRDTHLKVVFRRAGTGLQFLVESGGTADVDGGRLHMQGFVRTAAAMPPSRLNDAFTVEHALDGAAIPTNAGTYYAPLRALRFGAREATGVIRIAHHDFEFVANPLALYGGLCTAINYAVWLAGREFGACDDQFLPHRIGALSLSGALDGDEYRCHAVVRKLERDAVDLDFELVDSAGRVAFAVDTISLRRVARARLERQAVAARLPATRMPAVAPSPGVAGKVAIVGMACRYPMSENVDAFWENLKAGRDCVTEVPPERWSAHPDWYHPDPRHPHTSYSKWGGFLDRIDAFDALFFGISPAEAELIDPQQRIFLEECWKAIEYAGYAPGALANQACGVYVGCAGGDYARVLAGAGQDTAGAAFMGTSGAILAARISYHLNLKGAAVALDTACSSSLVAVHMACESIRSGENRLALAGGVNVLTTPLGHILTAQVGMPSRDGRCATFDASANGIVFSEGCGVLLLKALSDAQRDNDPILGVIQGSGTNQDGRTNGITAPSARAQEQLLRQVYGRFGIDPARIGYVEAHGTATPLGDPIEVNALAAVFGRGDANRCALGSVKSNIGHSGFAAGVAGIIKVLLCLKHKKLVPSIHYRQPNPHIAFEQSPFHVNTEYRDWPGAHARLAAVSSFGFSGTNAHVVIEEHVAAHAPAIAAEVASVFVPLSAKTDEQLRQKVRDLAGFLAAQPVPVDLACLAYTLQAGRDAMDYRLGFVVATVEQLQDSLRAFLEGSGRVWRGQASRDGQALASITDDADMRGVIAAWIARRDWSRLADLWVKGFELDWNALYGGMPPRRMVLPGYPFARERCWVEGGARVRGGGPILHPLLHSNTSRLGQQRYASNFRGDEFFLADHRVQGRPVLPAVAYLEMARAALFDALPPDRAAYFELRHVAWSQPIEVLEPTQVLIDVFAEEDGQFGFEVYSAAGGGEVLHCQGSCVPGAPASAPGLDPAGLRARMRGASVAGSERYPAFAALGLGYGPTLQGVAVLHHGEDELLAELSLPAAARRDAAAYVLHPSIMDSALQGSISLIGDIVEASGKPSLPFALESLRVFAACGERMLAWIRYAPGERHRTSSVVKVDIDLCDPDGRVCVQMRGFSSRTMDSSASSFDEAHYQSIIDGILAHEISVDEAVQLEDL